jgi:hypothetical protein
MALRLHSFVLAWICALLLATIGLQAVVPGDMADRSHGSAFSAQTHEVALAPGEDGRSTQLAVDPCPPGPPRLHVRPLAVVVRETPALRRASTGPAASSFAVRLPHPRAPPLT